MAVFPGANAVDANIPWHFITICFQKNIESGVRFSISNFFTGSDNHDQAIHTFFAASPEEF